MSDGVAKCYTVPRLKVMRIEKSDSEAAVKQPLSYCSSGIPCNVLCPCLR